MLSKMVPKATARCLAQRAFSSFSNANEIGLSEQHTGYVLFE